MRGKLLAAIGLPQWSLPQRRGKLLDWVEVQVLRNELQTVADLMQGYLGRERLLHEMMEQLMRTYQEMTQQFQGMHGEFMKHASSVMGEHDKQKSQLTNPMDDVQQELDRIKRILNQPPIAMPEANIHLQKFGGRR